MPPGLLKLCLGLLMASAVAASDPEPEAQAEEQTQEPQTQETPAAKWSAYEHVGADVFKKTLEENKYSLVAFVDADQWDSQTLEWEWPAIKEQVEGLLSVNCTAEPALCLEHDVRHYPTIRAYRSSTLFARYRGPRTDKEIVKFARRTRSHVVRGLEPAEVEPFQNSDDLTFVLHLQPVDAGKGLYKRYHDLAEQFHDRHSFGIISRAEEEGGDAEGTPTVVRCYNNAEGTERSLDTFYDHTVGLRNFVHACARRLVESMTRLNVNEFLEGERPVLYYFETEVPKRDELVKKLKDVAREHADRIQIVAVDPLTFPEVMAKMGLKWEFPAMALQDLSTKTITLYSQGEVNEGVVDKFIRDVLKVEASAGEAQVPEDEGVVLDGEGEGEAKAHDEL